MHTVFLFQDRADRMERSFACPRKYRSDSTHTTKKNRHLNNTFLLWYNYKICHIIRRLTCGLVHSHNVSIFLCSRMVVMHKEGELHSADDIYISVGHEILLKIDRGHSGALTTLLLIHLVRVVYSTRKNA